MAELSKQIPTSDHFRTTKVHDNSRIRSAFVSRLEKKRESDVCRSEAS